MASKKKSHYSGIYAIADEELLRGRDIFAAVEQALAGGISMLQYRNKLANNSGSSNASVNTAKQLAGLCKSYRVPLIINDNVDLCLAVAADGVHLGGSDQDLPSARACLGEDAIIGATCHASIEQALIAQRQTADYIAFGRFFPSSSKPEAPAAHLGLLTEARAALSIPIVAIGGINKENGASALKAGADMLAVIHAIFGGVQVAAQSRQLVSMYEQFTHERLTNSQPPIYQAD